MDTDTSTWNGATVTGEANPADPDPDTALDAATAELTSARALIATLETELATVRGELQAAQAHNYRLIQAAATSPAADDDSGDDDPDDPDLDDVSLDDYL